MQTYIYHPLDRTYVLIRDILLCYVMIFVQVSMASSSSSSYLSIDDEIRQVQAQIVVVEADIRSKGETLKQSSDEKEKDFLRGEITQLRQEKDRLRQEKDRLHQKELLLLQQRPQQQQLEAGKTVSYD
jgi:uncharacterized protein (DUF3084 family)